MTKQHELFFNTNPIVATKQLEMVTRENKESLDGIGWNIYNITRQQAKTSEAGLSFHLKPLGSTGVQLIL